MKRPAAAKEGPTYVHGFDREHKMAWRRLAGKRDARNEWAIEVTRSDTDGDGNEYPTAHFADGTEHMLQTLTWNEYNALVHAPIAGRLWEDKENGYYVIKKPDRTPLLILYETNTTPGGRDSQICQLQLRNFGDPHETALIGAGNGHYRAKPAQRRTLLLRRKHGRGGCVTVV